MRKIEQFKKMADDYDQMAVAVQDQALRTMFLEFANQWREAAQEAEILDSRPDRDLARPPICGPGLRLTAADQPVLDRAENRPARRACAGTKRRSLWRVLAATYSPNMSRLADSEAPDGVRTVRPIGECRRYNCRDASNPLQIAADP